MVIDLLLAISVVCLSGCLLLIRRDIETLYQIFSGHEKADADKRHSELEKEELQAEFDEAAAEARKAADRYLEGINNLLSYMPGGKDERK